MFIAEIDKEKAWQIRQEVMWPQKDLDFVKLAEDENGSHFGLFTDNDRLVSVVSIFFINESCQFRKFATVESEQGKGYGSTLLNYVLVEAKKQGAKKIWCNARLNKVDFYRRFGLEVTHSHFKKAGESYIIMEKYV
ncbi:GNAT family N-acetyltransferase [Aquibacillus salsiterrae]|uniref:GNAT family N-acetyltransferase n=1 Tax=Aquibacillus salsiterrae TaxID=2950439 RepID=A0A9X3WH79_9BACI|nr:GNAT family N-acetyltransferase [Aquibacillus salsiterrae]MDC3417404.1 GNAT family N-acetyltransferase [Aquibacillus salsiterrae]